MSLEVILSLFEDIKEAIELIKKRFQNIASPDDFISNENGLTKLDAISMRLQVIGETLKKVDKFDKKFLNNYPQIEWKKIKRMRDIISHHYNEVDVVEVFTACKYDIPNLDETVNEIINDLNNKGIL